MKAVKQATKSTIRLHFLKSAKKSPWAQTLVLCVLLMGESEIECFKLSVRAELKKVLLYLS